MFDVALNTLILDTTMLTMMYTVLLLLNSHPRNKRVNLACNLVLLASFVCFAKYIYLPLVIFTPFVIYDFVRDFILKK